MSTLKGFMTLSIVRELTWNPWDFELSVTQNHHKVFFYVNNGALNWDMCY